MRMGAIEFVGTVARRRRIVDQPQRRRRRREPFGEEVGGSPIAIENTFSSRMPASRIAAS